MIDEKKTTSTIKIKPPLDRFVERGKIIECLICYDIFYPSKYKLHSCLKNLLTHKETKLEEFEKNIFNDPIKLDKLLDIRPVVNFIWKSPNCQIIPLLKDKKTRRTKE